MIREKYTFINTFVNIYRFKLIGLVILLCISFHSNSQNKLYKNSELAVNWSNLALDILKTTPNGTPTYNSRFLGYLGLTMYETVVGANSIHKSITSKLESGPMLPTPPANKRINYYLSLNAGQSYIIQNMFGFTSESNLGRVKEFETENISKYSASFTESENNASIEYGRAIAQVIYNWSKSDGGHNMHDKIFDSNYIFPEGNGSWVAPIKGQSNIPLPMHHFWGKNRTFSHGNYILPIPEMIKYDYSKGSEYYNYMKEVYEVGKNLSLEQKEIALWWSDDPSETYSPPGHSYNIGTLAIKKSKADLVKAAQTYAAIGMATSDAFVNCWKTKFTHNVERPFWFIFYNIDNMWDMFFKEPPFPAYYSGHAAQGAAMAEVLTSLYGDKFSFIDDTHAGRDIYIERMIGFKPRKYKSFFEAADECAMSRLYAGIHTRLDNEMGLVEGKKVGRNIIELF